MAGVKHREPPKGIIMSMIEHWVRTTFLPTQKVAKGKKKGHQFLDKRRIFRFCELGQTDRIVWIKRGKEGEIKEKKGAVDVNDALKALKQCHR
uniref:Histone-lysine N-methyltransferase SETMAR n=1 Tax=Caenorhabditis tropicalis TaxID=1561998 RepID=A0A1I7T1S4_9PELO